WAEELALYVGSQVTVRGLPGVDWAFVYTQQDRVVAVRPKPRASWDTADGPANRLARSGRKLQRAYLRAIKQADAQVRIEVLDPSGDWRTAAANAAEAAADAKRGAGIEGDPPAPNPAALMPPAQRAAAAAAPAVNVPRRTIYALTDEEREQLRRLAE
ncbi:MAG: hypothetical protein GX595_07115, partial [Lentisphaerae bacterium]|nr:hypothetical protein [Lentisphaerota bacterium]